MTRWYRTRRRLGGVAIASAVVLTGCSEAGDDTPAVAASPATTPADDAAAAADPVSCLVLDEPDPAPSLTADVSFDPDPPVVEGTTIVIVLSRDGEPVSGADVCVRAEMPEMTHAGIAHRAHEAGAGRYEVETTWGMRGRWSGHARVKVDGETLVVPIETSVG